jgi:hypothetical protein
MIRVVPYLREVPEYLTSSRTPRRRSKRSEPVPAPITRREVLERLRRAVRR